MALTNVMLSGSMGRSPIEYADCWHFVSSLLWVAAPVFAAAASGDLTWFLKLFTHDSHFEGLNGFNSSHSLFRSSSNILFITFANTLEQRERTLRR